MFYNSILYIKIIFTTHQHNQQPFANNQQPSPHNHHILHNQKHNSKQTQANPAKFHNKQP